MARLKENELEKLKQEVSLLDLVQSYGVKLQKKGKDMIGLCPFHDDHSPSLVISPDKNLWHCMGACQEGGSVIEERRRKPEARRGNPQTKRKPGDFRWRNQTH
jgi:DNA primase